MFNHPRHKDASEADNRLDWWLREHGRPPTRAQLRRIRAHKLAGGLPTHLVRALHTSVASHSEGRGAAGPTDPAAPAGGAV